MMIEPSARDGFTLVELIVVLALMAILVSLTPIAMHSRREAGVSSLDSLVRATRARAVSSGRSVSVVYRDSAGTARILATPDGVVRSDSGVSIDAFVGRARADSVPGLRYPGARLQ